MARGRIASAFVQSPLASRSRYKETAACSRALVVACTASIDPSTDADYTSRKKPVKRAATGELSNVGSKTPVIQWYPGHIAKAERQLKDTLKSVDVVIEVRDCRIPRSTGHPMVLEWIGPNKGHVLVMNRADMAPDSARGAWRKYLSESGPPPRFVDAKLGRGVGEVKKAALLAGQRVNEKRKARGLLPRAVRCMVLGYPNVGKSALINRLVGRKAVKSQNKPGVTRSLQWVRIAGELEMLDTPGIIPAKLVDQRTALKLALCDDIGQAAYDPQIVAAELLNELLEVNASSPGYVDLEQLTGRYKGVSIENTTGEQYLEELAKTHFNSDSQRAAMRMLTDFRSGRLGTIALESPEVL